MQKVLIITYYWPPAGGGGVQRWMKFAKYLPHYGWQPIIYAPEQPDYPLIDHSLEQEISPSLRVIKRRIKEPRKYLRSLTGKSTGSGASADQMFYIPKAERSWKQNLIIWIRGNLFIPDARTWWVKPSEKYLRKLIKQEQIDTIVTTGPPHSMHLIGYRLKRYFPDMRWLADFRDPWTFIEFYDKMMLTQFADWLHRKLERKVLKAADAVVTVSPFWAEKLSEIGGKHVHTITNGYDLADFPQQSTSLDDQVSICHVGTLALDRNPQQLWTVMQQMRTGNATPTIKFLGSTDPRVLTSLQERGLAYVDLGYVDHAKAIAEMQSAHYLLLLINDGTTDNARGRIPGKVFEYLAARRPILAICPSDTDIAKILTEQGHQVIAPEKLSVDRMEEALMKMQQWVPDDQPPPQYTRQYLTARLADVLNDFNAAKRDLNGE